MLFSDKVQNLLSTRLVGQPHVVEPIADAVLVAEAGMTPEERCAGAFLLLGPTGTGKTKTVRLVAEALHGDPKKMLRIDCGEYQLEHEVAKLIGAPPGFVGHKETPGELSAKKVEECVTKDCPYAVILFDEIEKAHSSIHRLLLGVMEGPTLTAGGVVTNFHNSLIFMTSNLGAGGHSVSLERAVGYQSVDKNHAVGISDGRYQESARKFFSSEFMGRLDGLYIYHELSTTELHGLVNHEIRALATRVPREGFSVVITGDVREELLRKADTKRYGGRDIRTVIHREIGIPLARQVAGGQAGDIAFVYFQEGKFVVRVSSDSIFSEVA